MNGELVSGCLDQPSQGPKAGLSASGLIDADDRLGDARPPSEIALGQVGPLTRGSQHCGGVDWHDS